MNEVSEALAMQLMNEGLISLAKAAAELPLVRGKRVSKSSVFRWIIRGKRSVKLEAIKLNGTNFWTTRQALARFAARLSSLPHEQGASNEFNA